MTDGAMEASTAAQAGPDDMKQTWAQFSPVYELARLKALAEQPKPSTLTILSGKPPFSGEDFVLARRSG